MSHQCICKHGYIVHKSLLTEAAIGQIKTALTMKPKVHAAFLGLNEAKPFPIYREDEQRLFLPRFWAEHYFGPPKFTQFNKIEQWPDLPDSKFSPRPYQTDAWEALNRVFKPDQPAGGGGVLLLPCGYGKTVLALQTAWRLRQKTLIVVHKEFLMNQWMDEISEWFPGQTIGRIQADIWKTDGCFFTLAMMQSIYTGKHPIDKFAAFGLTIVDEVHQIGSEHFSQALPYIFTKYTLGLSATPERSDGCSGAFYSHLGPLFHQEKRKTTQQVTVIMPKLSGTFDGIKHPSYQVIMRTGYNGSTTKNTMLMSQRITECEPRNEQIAQLICQLAMNPNRQIIVFSAFRDHLLWFGTRLAALGLTSVGFYWGNDGSLNKAKYRESLAEAAKCKVVLSTTKLGSHGLNIPTLNTLIFASPPGADLNIIDQMCGRILRQPHPAESAPLIYDLVDQIGNFPKHAKERSKYYSEMEYSIVEQ